MYTTAKSDNKAVRKMKRITGEEAEINFQNDYSFMMGYRVS